MWERIKEFMSLVFFVGIILISVIGFFFGPEEVRIKAGGAGLLALVTGVPYLIYTLIHGTNTNEQMSEDGLDLSDDKWANEKKYGYDGQLAITVKNIDKYLSNIETLKGTQITWKRYNTENVKCGNYNDKETRIDIVKIKAENEHMPLLYFIEGCRENSSNIPNGYRRKNGIQKKLQDKDLTGDNVASSQLAATANSAVNQNENRQIASSEELMSIIDEQNVKPSRTVNAEPISTERELKADKTENDSANQQNPIPMEMLRKLKTLYDQGILTDEEFKEKKKQLLNL